MLKTQCDDTGLSPNHVHYIPSPGFDAIPGTRSVTTPDRSTFMLLNAPNRAEIIAVIATLCWYKWSYCESAQFHDQ